MVIASVFDDYFDKNTKTTNTIKYQWLLTPLISYCYTCKFLRSFLVNPSLCIVTDIAFNLMYDALI